MRASSPMPELSRYCNPLRLRTICLWPSPRRRDTFSRRTPTSKKVRRPRRSIREACGVCRMVAEKSNVGSCWLVAVILLCRGTSEQEISVTRKYGERTRKKQGKLTGHSGLEVSRNLLCSSLLAHDDTQSATPAFRETDAYAL